MSPVPPPPDALPALKSWLAARPDAEALKPIEIQRIVIDPRAVEQLGDVLSELGLPRRLVLVMDDTSMRRGPDLLKPLVHEALTGGGRYVQPFTFAPGGDGLVHADLEGAGRLAAAIGEVPTTVVALGSGSVCDMAKQACRQSGEHARLVLVPTALSVTAYTSSLAVLLKDGVKRTFPTRFPDAVVVDLQTVRDAPAAMTRAGLGDCCARFVSYGDWYLSNELGLVDLYSETPLALMGEELDREYLSHARAVYDATDDGLLFLARQVLLAGLAQSVVNLSAPLSGTEHVVSHVLDMGAAAWGRRLALHGAQVGVATQLAARAYELLYEQFDPRRERPAAPDSTRAERTIHEAFLRLDASGQMGAECWADYRLKLAAWDTRADHFDRLRERWESEVMPRLQDLVRPAATIREILERAGHPLEFEELEPSIPAWQARFALAHAHLIRRRFTIGDLFAFLGTDGPALAEALLPTA